MDNKDYFEYISKKPFEEKLKAFGNACESMVRNSIKSVQHGIGEENRQWYDNESKAQAERANFLFKNLIEDYEKEIEERGSITVPEDYVTWEAFEEWLYESTDKETSKPAFDLGGK